MRAPAVNAALDLPEFVVYAYYDDCDLLYVGQTSDLQARNRSHRSVSHWYRWATRVEVVSRHDSRSAALAAEKVAIRSMWPAYNSETTRFIDREYAAALPDEPVAS